MSSKSRGRHRFDQEMSERDAAAEEQQSKWATMMDAFERANTRGGLRDLVGLVLKDREEELAPTPPAKADPQGPRLHSGGPVREPTQYEQAILSGLARKAGWNQRGGRGIDPYGGTVEPWRIEQRRRRNKAARAARSGRHVATGGSSKAARLRRRAGKA